MCETSSSQSAFGRSHCGTHLITDLDPENISTCLESDKFECYLSEAYRATAESEFGTMLID
jgi:hypothetical protein